MLGLQPGFVVALVLLAASSFVAAVTRPMRQAYLNGVIPSEQRATVLSFDSLMGSAGGVVAQPILGRVADVSGYAASYAGGGRRSRWWRCRSCCWRGASTRHRIRSTGRIDPASAEAPRPRRRRR